MSPSKKQRARERIEGRRRTLVTALRGAVLALSAVVLCWPLTVPTGVVAAALGAALGTVLGDRAARSHLRTASGLLLAAAAALAGIAFARGLVGSEWLAGALGPIRTLHVGEAVLWLSALAPLTFGLRLVARRRPTLAVLEVVMVAAATAAGFAAHRDGMVHRPLALGDWAWSRGIDPAVLFLVLGGIATFAMAALLVQEGRARRLPLHFAGLLVVALVLAVFVRVEGLPKPDPAGGLGLTGEPEDADGERDARRAQRGDAEGDEGDGGGKSDEQKHELGDLEFQDDYSGSGEQSPVAVVVLHDDYSPPPGVYYFRQSAFSQYNGRRLVQATRDDVDLDIVHRFPFHEERIEAAPPTDYGRRALRTTMGLMVDHVRPFALDSPAVLRPSDNPNPLRFQRTFEVRSHVQVRPYDELLGRKPGHPDWTEEQWRHYTEAPTDPRYAEMVETMLEPLQEVYRHDPLARALAVKQYLDTNGIYSRKSRHANADDPAASFLFGNLTGYCVHFAHAAAYLYRTSGIPARVAAGYAVGEEERAGGSTIVIRGGSAHAWPEIYLENIGWVVVDLSPVQSLEDPMPAPDPRLQQMLGEMMRQGETGDDFGDQVQEPIDWAALFRRFLALLGLALLASYAIKLYRRLAPRFVDEGRLPRIGYRASLDRLADVGLVRAFGESRESFARRVRPTAPSFEPLTGVHLGSALGSAGYDARDTRSDDRTRRSRGDLRRLLSDTAEELHQTIPAWRRCLGWLDPFSWIRVR